MRQPLHVSTHWPAAEGLYVYFSTEYEKDVFSRIEILKMNNFSASFLSETDIVLLQVCGGSEGNSDCEYSLVPLPWVLLPLLLHHH